MIVGYIIAGFGVGTAIGLTGVGGGSLMTPILILAFGLSPSTAIGTDLLYATATKGFGAMLHGRQRTVDWPVVGLMASGSLPAALVTIVWLNYVGLTPFIEHLMTITLCAAIFATAIVTLLRQRLFGRSAAGADAVVLAPALIRWRGVITVVSGIFLGAMVALSSVGAGVLGTTMLLLLYPRFDTVRVVGTDISHAVPLTLVAGLGHLTLGTAHLSYWALLLIGSLPGMYLGTRLAIRTPDDWLRKLIAILLLAAAGSMLWHILSVFGVIG